MEHLLSKMTERQRKAWDEDVLPQLREQDVPSPEVASNWMMFEYEDETSPGRGHTLNAVYNDGETFAQVRMDVYGFPSISVAELYWYHNSSDEECLCQPCVKMREQDEAEFNHERYGR